MTQADADKLDALLGEYVGDCSPAFKGPSVVLDADSSIFTVWPRCRSTSPLKHDPDSGHRLVAPLEPGRSANSDDVHHLRIGREQQ